MKVIMINGSPNTNGCTVTAFNEVAKVLHANEIDTEIIHVGNKDIRGCIGCKKCRETKKCVFDDLVNEIATVFAESDGLIIGSPVYYSSPNGNVSGRAHT
jgi:multimeric flavodoxin WrbA